MFVVNSFICEHAKKNIIFNTVVILYNNYRTLFHDIHGQWPEGNDLILRFSTVLLGEPGTGKSRAINWIEHLLKGKYILIPNNMQQNYTLFIFIFYMFVY